MIAVAKETLEGHQRAIMGTMSVEEIYRDRKKFSSGVFKVASTDLINMGIMVISYTIKEITDDVGYLKALGMARTAEVQRDARVGEAQAKMQSSIAEAKVWQFFHHFFLFHTLNRFTALTNCLINWLSLYILVGS